MSQTKAQLIDAVNGSIVTADIADQAITLDKLLHGTGSTDGKFLRANNGADPTFESVITDLVNDTSPQLGGDLASNGNDIDFADNDKAVFGAGSDLQIYHDSSSSYIKDNSNQLYIRANAAIKFENDAGSETFAKFHENGNVELYYDNSKKFETMSTGAYVEGYLAFPDNGGLKIGSGNDLQIYHDGTHSRLLNNTGLFLLQGSDIRFANTAGTETIIKGVENGGVELYYDDSKKFETLSTGCAVTGELDVSGNIDLNSDSHRIKLGAGDDFQLYHDGSNNHITTNNGDINIITTGDDISIQAQDDIFLLPAAGENGIGIYSNAQVILYYDSVSKLETNSTGIDILGTGSDAGGVSFIKFKSGNGSHRANIGKTSGSNGRLSIMNLDNDSVEFGTSNSVKLELQDAGHLLPSANGSYNLGGTSNRWANIYTSDLDLSNESKGGNDIDGTWGSYTIQEGSESLFLINKRNGKKYKFNLTEVS